MLHCMDNGFKAFQTFQSCVVVKTSLCLDVQRPFCNVEKSHFSSVARWKERKVLVSFLKPNWFRVLSNSILITNY